MTKTFNVTLTLDNLVFKLLLRIKKIKKINSPFYHQKKGPLERNRKHLHIPYC